MKRVGETNRLWPPHVQDSHRVEKQTVLLHFGAVDWEANVYVNGKESRRSSRRL